jgi:hypothetical protein
VYYSVRSIARLKYNWISFGRKQLHSLFLPSDIKNSALPLSISALPAPVHRPIGLAALMPWSGVTRYLPKEYRTLVSATAPDGNQAPMNAGCAWFERGAVVPVRVISDEPVSQLRTGGSNFDHLISMAPVQPTLSRMFTAILCELESRRSHRIR